MPKSPSVEEYRAALDAPTRDALDALRRIVMEAAPDLTEEIKWNAPSFAHKGRDRVTLGVEPRGGYRIVLHRGAKAQDGEGFHFDDPDKIATWPAPDRGVVRLRDATEIKDRAASLRAFITRWIAATE
ncbi:MAG: DUF1801 domain-containing protein [Caulobacteraceae bacterium]|nr:DUF1801 domain-containing protein [Caulobacteraceae bacterium]